MAIAGPVVHPFSTPRQEVALASGLSPRRGARCRKWKWWGEWTHSVKTERLPPPPQSLQPGPGPPHSRNILLPERAPLLLEHTPYQGSLAPSPPPGPFPDPFGAFSQLPATSASQSGCPEHRVWGPPVCFHQEAGAQQTAQRIKELRQSRSEIRAVSG